VLENVADGQKWAIPKFFAMRKYEPAIMLLGDVEQLSSAPGERTNAELKAHARFTNRQADYMDQVMMLTPAGWQLSQPIVRRSAVRACRRCFRRPQATDHARRAALVEMMIEHTADADDAEFSTAERLSMVRAADQCSLAARANQTCKTGTDPMIG
jgi:hypothetical protein